MELNKVDIYIHNSECVVCGREIRYLSRHHLIPKILKPKSNVVVGVCKECHRKIHIQIKDFKMLGIPYCIKMFVENKQLKKANKALRIINKGNYEYYNKELKRIGVKNERT